VAKAPAVLGHAGQPPPVAVETDVGTVNTTRWYAVIAPSAAAAVTTLEESVEMAVPEGAVVTKKAFAVGAIAYSIAEASASAFTGHDDVAVAPEPVTVVGAGAVNETTCPVKRVPTAAENTSFVMPVTGTAAEKVDTWKLPDAGAAAYRAAPAIAAAVAGHATMPPPVSSVVLPLWLKKSAVPEASVVPLKADIAWFVIPEMAPDKEVDPTTQ